MDPLTAAVRIYPSGDFAPSAARCIAEQLARARSALVTGGRTARLIYEQLARFEGIPNLEVAFSDERAVPPEHAHSNYGMASRSLLDPLGLTNVHRMRAEDDPTQAAFEYEREIADLIEQRFDVALLGLGADAHVAGLFPGAPALFERHRLCVAVERPDGLGGITLTARALTASRCTIVVASGAGKADAVRRALRTDEPLERCPAKLLAGAPSLTFLLDTDAGRLL